MRKFLLAAAVASLAALTSIAVAPAQQASIDLGSSAPAANIVGRGFGDELSRVAVGDVNGDGRGDIIIGARRSDGADKSRPDTGAVFIFFGTGGFSGTKDLAAAAQNVVIFGADAFDNTGQALASGDVNGDGIDDIIIGSRGSGPGNSRPNAGEVYVIFGGTFGKSINIGKNQQDVTILGAEALDNMGKAIAVGDVTGDGIADIIIGADDADGSGNSRPNSGEVYIVRGSRSLAATIDLAGGGAMATIFGAEAGDDIGTAVAAADVNGDGRADVIIGADDASGPGNTRPGAGEAYVVSGAGLSGNVDLAGSGATLTIFGAEGADNLGNFVIGGDVNGDGRADVIVTADMASGAGNGRLQSGETYVIFGRPGLSGTVDVAASQESVRILGAQTADQLGGALAVGDVTGDGIRDIVIGADEGEGANNTATNVGEVYVIAGSAGLAGTLDLAANAQRLTIFGADQGDDFSRSIAVGNVLGDARREVLVAAPQADGRDNARSSAGEVYIINLGGAGTGGPGGASAGDGVLAGIPTTGVGPGVDTSTALLPWAWLFAAGGALIVAGLFVRGLRRRASPGAGQRG